MTDRFEIHPLKERMCQQYQCGQPYYYSLPEFGDMCKGCYLEYHEQLLEEE
jgi:hypothetical protein